MTTATPWTPPPGTPERQPDPRPAEPYRDMLMALCLASREDPNLSTAAAIEAAIELAADLSIMSGMAWASPDIIESLRNLADDLEARRTGEPPPPLLMTMRACFAAARPPERAN
jgi:hypothetical protein